MEGNMKMKKKEKGPEKYLFTILDGEESDE